MGSRTAMVCSEERVNVSQSSNDVVRIFTYSVFQWTGEMLPTSSIEAAKDEIRARYRQAHFGRWVMFRNGRGRSLPVWSSTVQALRFDLGEIQDANKPVAYVRVQDWSVIV
jgi:hypothetical protein